MRLRDFIASSVVMVWFGFAGYAQKGATSKEIATEERTVAAYTAVEVSGSVDVVLTQGTVGQLRVTTHREYLPKIITQVEGGVLKVDVQHLGLARNIRRMVVHIPVDSHLERVTTKGSGDVNGEGEIAPKKLKLQTNGSGDIALWVKANSVTAISKGSGDMMLKGEVEQLNVESVGSGDILTKNLKAREVVVTTKDSGDVWVFASERVKATSSGSGDIKVSGNPKQREQRTTGSGDISFIR